MEIRACVFDVDHTRRELQAHGTPEFPCAGYETLYTAGPEGDICWHWHEDMELWQVLEGEMELRVPGHALLLREGECAAVNQNVLHAGEAKGLCRLRALVFSPALVTGGADTVFARRYLRPLNACAAFDACALGAEEGRAFEEAFAALSAGGEGFEFAVRGALSRLCLALFRRFAPAKQTGAPPDLDGERLRAMLAFLHENYARPIQLCEVARAANVSARECLRCFRRAIQTPPMQYLLKYRVQRGAEMLRDHPADTVAQVAASCGFDSPSNFSKNFRRFYGLSPKDYRSRALSAQSDI